MKILIVTIHSFGADIGGVEKVVVNFLNAMLNRGHETVLAYCGTYDECFYYDLNPLCKRISLLDFIPGHEFYNAKKTIGFKLHREFLRLFGLQKVRDLNSKFKIDMLGKALDDVLRKEKPDIIIGTSQWESGAVVYADKRHKYPFIAMCHVDANSVLEFCANIDKKNLSQSDVIQVLMPKDQEILGKAFPHTKIVCIGNLVPQYKIEKDKCKVIVNVARLDKIQKRQHLLIEAFSRIADRFSDWTVEFWGDENGKCKYTHELKELICKYHLEERVKLCGRTDDVLSVYRRASIFAFPSAYEGFGLSMTEAMSAGLPVVAYRSCPAVNELVRDGETGLLVDDGVGALAEGLKKLMEDQELRERMGRAAHESMKEFAPEKIWDQWEALMQDVIAKHKEKMER